VRTCASLILPDASDHVPVRPKRPEPLRVTGIREVA